MRPRLSHTIKYAAIFLSLLLLLCLFIWLVAPKYTEFIPYTLYIVASTTFLAIPHEPLVLLYGKHYGPYLPVLFGILPTIIGCYIDYLILTPLFKLKHAERLKQTNFYIFSLKYFSKLPFITVSLVALSPVPFHPVRILSIASDYPVYRYTSAVVVGRIPRFLLLAVGGSIFDFSMGYIILIFIVFMAWYPFSRLITQLIHYIKAGLYNRRQNVA
jgi:membrane protein YqaA with SNARE-associated domain